jgi:hypothetical protein
VLPLIHVLHVDEAALGAMVPLAHGVHIGEPACGEYEPGKHAVQLREPVALLKPAEHSEQLAVPARLANVPASHIEHVDAPASPLVE